MEAREMADIRQAAKWMVEGKSVYSSDSQRSSAIYMNEAELFYSTKRGARVQFSLSDLLAGDWEIAK
jgi:hypothetical protein